MAEYIDREKIEYENWQGVCWEKPITVVRKCSIDSMSTADVVPANWVRVKEKPPENEAEVLAVCVRSGYRFVCPAIYEDGTVLTQDSIWSWYDLDNYGTYSEENDDYFVPQGWWENRQFTPDDVYNSPIDCEVTHWMQLPKVPRVGDDNG
jgi:hypothetical protein